MPEFERRNIARMPYTDLPEVLRIFQVNIGDLKNIKAETIDASTEGIGLHIPSSCKNIKKGDGILMQSLDKRFEFTGIIMYLMEAEEGKCRIGVKFA